MSQRHGNLILGIRREDKNVWERRVPLTPAHVEQLLKQIPGLKIVVQPSSTRVFTDDLYEKAGAVVQEDLGECGTVIAVKEIPIRYLVPGKTYVFFSHTIKAQPYNMRMLDHILEQKIRLMDYERIVKEDGRRTVFFGRHAGYAGMIDTLASMGISLLHSGTSTPFLYTSFSRSYPTLEAAKTSVAALGKMIAESGLPKKLGPLIFGFTGRGNASKGAQDIFQLLPHKMIQVDEIAALATSKDFDNHVVYGVEILASHYCTHKDGKTPFDKSDYKANPADYVSNFHTAIAPHLSVLVNCMYWDVSAPRLLTNDQTKVLAESGNLRMVCLGDITCDPGGSVEFMSKVTYIDKPFYYYDPIHEACSDHPTPGAIIVMAVDNLPAEIPVSSCEYFGNSFLPYVEDIVKSDKPTPEALDLHPHLRPAVFTVDGKLTPQVSIITELRQSRAAHERHILILGSGRVVAPAVHYLHRDERNHITIASMILSEAEAIADGMERVGCEELNIANATDEELRLLFQNYDLVVSLIPPVFHVRVAKICLATGKNFLTASYQSEEMAALHEEAKHANLIFVNEMGLDPGIDHITAMEEIRQIRAEGGKVRSFLSVCGGLPAPENSDNPLAYKFSWSPRGVLSAGKRSAKYLWDGKEKEVPPAQLFTTAQDMMFDTGYDFEGYPNGNSLGYVQVYGLEHAHTLMRGTLRYRGFSEVMLGFAKLNLMDETPRPYLQPDAPDISWLAVLSKFFEVPESAVEATVEKLTADVPDETHRSCIDALRWLGLFSQNLAPKKGTIIDALCAVMQAKMSFGEGETDLVYLHHEFGVENADGTQEVRTSTLQSYGSDAQTAMSTLVGTPVGIGAQMILDGDISERGVILPVTESITSRAMKLLEAEGIVMRRGVRTSSKKPNFA